MTQRRFNPASEMAGRQFPTRNDLPVDVREPIVEMLNQSLSDTTDLLTQSKFAHWNVKGQNFYQLHLLFDELAETLGEHQDLLAERATALGGQAMGTVRMAARNSSIPEIPVDAITGDEYVRGLADNLAVHAGNLRRDIDAADSYGDEDTMDLYIEVSRDVDKFLWFLDAHLQTRPIETASHTGNPRRPSMEEQVEMPSSRGREQAQVRPSGGRRYGRHSAERTGAFDKRVANW